MVILHFTPKKLNELLGLPKDYTIEAIELNHDEYSFYVDDGKDEIVVILQPQFTWQFPNQLQLPERMH